MKVEKCCTKAAAPDKFTLTFEDIKKREGVYRTEEMLSSRLVVINNVVLYSGVNRLEIADGTWRYKRYERTAERVAFEILPPL